MKINDEKRIRIIGQIRNYLMSFGNPRFQMFIILGILFIAGFLLSTALYNLGIEKMWLRYSISLFFSYFLFFMLVRIWSFLVIKSLDFQPKEFTESLDLDQTIDVTNILARIGLKSERTIATDNPFNSSLDSDIYDWIADHEYTLLVSLLAIITISILFLLGYVLLIAPMLLSEIIFELIIVSIVYKKVKKYQATGWYDVLFIRTIIPFASVLLVFTITAYIIQSYFPEAETMKDIIYIIKNL